MKLLQYAAIFLCAGSLSYAQTQQFTMSDAVNGLRSNLAVKNLSQATWLKGSNSVAYMNNRTYFATDAVTNKTDTLVSLYRLNKGLGKDQALKALPMITFTSATTGYYKQANNYFKVEKKGNDWTSTKWTSIPEKAANVNVIADKDLIVYTIDNNLYSIASGVTHQITNDSNLGIVNGQAVHRSEFGISGGIFVSPDGKKIAFYRMDESMVNDYPIVNWSGIPAKNENIKYPMAGGVSHEVTLGVFDIQTQKTTFVKTEGPKDQYLTAISWSPNSKNIFIGVLDRGQKNLAMNMYDSSNGNYVKTLFKESSAKYVEPQNPLTFFPNSEKDFIWQSQRTGFNHLFHYNIDKGLVKQITKGDWLVTGILGFNEKKSEIYFTSTKETALERHLYRINWKSLKQEKLTKEGGMHAGVLSNDGTFLYDSYNGAGNPRKVDLISTSTLKSTNLLTAENPLSKYQRPEIKDVTLKADDGTPLYGKLILPTNFDATKKYPTIVYLYNGPHLQLVTNTFPESGNLWYEYMAQNGYVVFTMDGRGSSNRGLAFEQAVWRTMGENEMKDQLKGVDYLKSLPYVNADKMGVHGWSYGGFMTTSLMLKYPEVFKVGVAGGPVIDWNMYEIMYTERYMDHPKNNPEGYKNAALFDKIKNLKGKLLMIHGAQDDVVVWQHSMDFVRSAVDNGVQMDYFVYPGHAHNVLGKDRVHLMQKVTDYFDLYLKDKK